MHPPWGSFSREITLYIYKLGCSICLHRLCTHRLVILSRLFIHNFCPHYFSSVQAEFHLKCSKKGTKCCISMSIWAPEGPFVISWLDPHFGKHFIVLKLIYFLTRKGAFQNHKLAFNLGCSFNRGLGFWPKIPIRIFSQKNLINQKH